MKTTGLSILDVTQNINLEFIGGAGWIGSDVRKCLCHGKNTWGVSKSHLKDFEAEP